MAKTPDSKSEGRQTLQLVVLMYLYLPLIFTILKMRQLDNIISEVPARNMVFTNTRNMNKLFKGNQDITLVFKRISLKKKEAKNTCFHYDTNPKGEEINLMQKDVRINNQPKS